MPSLVALVDTRWTGGANPATWVWGDTGTHLLGSLCFDGTGFYKTFLLLIPSLLVTGGVDTSSNLMISFFFFSWPLSSHSGSTRGASARC